MFALYALSAAFHLYVGARIVPALPGPWAAGAFVLLLVVSALSMPLGLIARRFARPPFADKLAWIGLLCMGLFSSLLVLTFFRDIALLFIGTPEFWRTSAELIPPIALVLTLIGLVNARRTAAVKRVEVPIAGLPPALDGFRIVQISDVHVGPTIKQRYIEQVVERVNALKPDVIAVTGDLVDGSVAELRQHVAPLAQLRAKHGAFFVTGNHEYYSGADAWVREVRRLGLRVLMNEHEVIEHGGSRLVLAGVPDYGAGHFDTSHTSDPRRALEGAPTGVPKVLLAHQPRSARAAAEAGFDLQLSGHTHGGQFLPWNLLVPLQQPFTAGLHRLGNLWVYVSRGTGYWGPPKRVGAPSEIGEIVLRAA
ncbi:metallophosphoesterase [Ramlibacter albus]|uniref:Metallophosphoesterase n=1 Tax=Ramlibacter albus TaxID=2079448 RepID=A0A923S136_9BURK|nr:metallophosphoesterase [Ramlibacter albus]MBC5763880.1 metallophosphoesterase [Ramlibacter albus]